MTIRVADDNEKGEKKTGKDETEETRLRVITTTIWKFKVTVLNSFKKKPQPLLFVEKTYKSTSRWFHLWTPNCVGRGLPGWVGEVDLFYFGSHSTYISGLFIFRNSFFLPSFVFFKAPLSLPQMALLCTVLVSVWVTWIFLIHLSVKVKMMMVTNLSTWG